MAEKHHNYKKYQKKHNREKKQNGRSHCSAVGARRRRRRFSTSLSVAVKTDGEVLGMTSFCPWRRETGKIGENGRRLMYLGAEFFYLESLLLKKS